MLLDLLVDIPDENISANTMKHYGGVPYISGLGTPNANMSSSQILSQLPAHNARMHLRGAGPSGSNLRLMGSPKEEQLVSTMILHHCDGH
jgi:hypothetical protein